MRLSRDTSGTFDQAKDSLQRDLVTLQRTIDQLESAQASLKTDISTIQTQLANPTISVAANGSIGGLPKSLQVVVHDTTMTGFGTPASPLHVVPVTFGIGNLLSVTMGLTDAQLRALNTTPVEIVAAPGANITLLALYWTVVVNVTAGFSANASLSLRYPDGTSGGLATGNLGLTTTGVRITLSGQNSGQFNTAASTENKALQLLATADRTGGTTSGGAVFTLYYVSITRI